MCIRDSGSDRAETLKKTVQLVRELMNELSIPIERVVRHYDASRKNCPQSMRKNDWAEWFEFKECLKGDSLTMSQYDELKSRIDELNKKLDKLINPMIYNYIDDNMPEWAHKSVKWLSLIHIYRRHKQERKGYIHRTCKQRQLLQKEYKHSTG